MDINEIKELLVNAEREAAELVMQAHDVIAESKTGSRDVVTEYDRRVQLLIEQRVRSLIPEAGFFCEELGEQSGTGGEHVFIIDPIDGTMNFVKGFNHSCISAAYASRGEALAAAVYNPYMDELFTAVKGAGAFLNGRPIHVDDCGLAQSVICFGTSPYDQKLTDRSMELVRSCMKTGLDVRRQGSAELDLCSVAAGRAGLYFELSVSLWDYAAGALIVREAGGLCLREDGGELPMTGEKSSILAGGRKAVREYFELVRSVN